MGAEGLKAILWHGVTKFMAEIFSCCRRLTVKAFTFRLSKDQREPRQYIEKLFKLAHRLSMFNFISQRTLGEYVISSRTRVHALTECRREIIASAFPSRPVSESPGVVEHSRPRVCSLPEKAYNPRLSDDLYRLRTFSITNKGGVVNCGDSICNRRSRSNTSVNSTNSR
ncbi:hypothetical protein EVAR_25427_1 [Eumeta japonica]|uniref:Uncharacterized protein n=1 Tax=Eumeta variegata TaxID=151549 RepID=A0A4C1V620_EUMVA|nr:hypothetical protein EVAR_25427_1 [Eumeta japonica]